MRRSCVGLLFLFSQACLPSAFDKLEGTADAGTMGDAPVAPTGVVADPDAGACSAPDGGTDCTPDEPAAACLGPRCTEGCPSGFADCDDDRDLGPSSNGCETHIVDDARHCGGCGLRCTMPSNGYAMCQALQCNTASLVREPPVALASHGGTVSMNGGGMFDQICPEGGVMTGVEGKISNNRVVDSMRLLCARLTVTPGDTNVPNIVLGESYFPYTQLGGHPQLDQDKTPRKPYALHCGPGELVTELQLAVWKGLQVNGERIETIQDVAFRCAKASIGPGLEVVIGPGGPLIETGLTHLSTSLWSVDRCTDSALAGLKGRHGLHVDQVIGHCSAFKLVVGAAAR